MPRGAALLLTFVLGMAAPVSAVDAGKAAGSVTIDASITALTVAVETRKENLFDDTKQDTVIVLSDKPLGSTKPDDEIGLSMRARRGELTVLTLRIDGGKLVNVTINHKDLSGLIILPGPWFQYTPARATAGTLKLPRRDFEGHAYTVDVEFAAGRSAAPRPAPAPAAPAQPNAPGRQ